MPRARRKTLDNTPAVELKILDTHFLILHERDLSTTPMLIERRAADRKATDVNIEFHCCEKGCNGRANDISQKGMFIKTKDLCFPINSPFDIYYSSNGKTFRIPVTLSRLVRAKNKTGIGISFINSH